MKKLILLVAFLLVLSVSANADMVDNIKKLPAFKQGIMFDVQDSTIDYLSTAQLVSWKGFSLEAGYTTSDKLAGVISYKLVALKDLGVDVPIADLIELNVGYGLAYGRIDLTDGFGEGNNEVFHGPTLTLISFDW